MNTDDHLDNDAWQELIRKAKQFNYEVAEGFHDQPLREFKGSEEETSKFFARAEQLALDAGVPVDVAAGVLVEFALDMLWAEAEQRATELMKSERLSHDEAFKRAMEEYLSVCALLEREFKIRAATVSPATRQYHGEILKQLRQTLPKIQSPPNAIGEADIAKFAENAGHFSGSRWNAMVGFLKRVIPAAKTLRRRRVIPKRLPPPSPQEFTALLAACDRLAQSKAGLVVAFLARTGLRISAARALKWSDIHADRIEYINKGGRRCSVPIFKGLRDTLEQLRTISDGSEFVLPRAGIRTGLIKACKAAGLRPLSHHDFRHLFTTRCIESGVDLPTVARWRGDSDGGAMLAKHYFHLMSVHSQTMARKVTI